MNAVNCNTSWKITLFMKYSSYREDVLKGVSMLGRTFAGRIEGCLTELLDAKPMYSLCLKFRM